MLTSAAPRPVSTRRARLTFTPAARRALVAVSRRDGQQAVLLAWSAGAAYLPCAAYVPYAFDVILGHVAGCPIYVDARRLAMFRDERVVLDVDPAARSAVQPALATRPASKPDTGVAATTIENVRAVTALLLHRELAAPLVEVYTDAQIGRYVQDAINDLRGSVSSDALPEVAARLACHRLCTVVSPMQAGEA
jgi:uncharacterized protein (DUF779 family)